MRIRGVSERPAGPDERLASIFKDMRRGLNIPVDKLALALKTTPHVIQLLETGQVRAFPPWPETVRIVTELGQLYRVDTRPILNRICDQVGPAGLEQVPATEETTISAKAVAAKLDSRHPLVRAMSRGRRRKEPSPAPEAQRLRTNRRKRRAARTLFALSAPVALLGGMVWLAQDPAVSHFAGCIDPAGAGGEGGTARRQCVDRASRTLARRHAVDRSRRSTAAQDR